MCGYALFLFSLTRATNKINHDTRTIDKDKAIQRKGIFGAYGVHVHVRKHAKITLPNWNGF